jgi:hypothetical protein
VLRYLILARALAGYRLYVAFRDGLEGVVDLAPHISFKDEWAPLRDPRYFAQVWVDTDQNAAVWPNGVKFHSEILYGLVADSASPMP